MNNILIIKNHADDALLIDFAYKFARQNGKNLVIAQLHHPALPLQLSHELVGTQAGSMNANKISGVNQPLDGHGSLGLAAPLPTVKTVDASRLTSREMAAWIRKEGFDLTISRLSAGRLNMQSLLNKLSCPLMLLPEDFATKEIHRTVYLTDLRYCQQSILSQLTRLKSTSLLLAHTCQSGLPDLVGNYGNQLFADTAGRYSASQELFFSHIKERNVQKVIDILVNTMRADMLVCLNRAYHFQQFFGDQLPKRLPAYITVPLLVFPA